MSAHRCPGCGCSGTHPPYCPYSAGCLRGCPAGECYCSEPTYAEMNDACGGCGAWDGDCYCEEL